MNDIFGWLFSSANFMPHGHCFLWQPATLWLNVGSDGLIAASYFAIPVALYYYVRHRKEEIPYVWMPLMFAAFIFLCGGTHIMEIWTVWDPVYRAEGALKLLTGLVSFATTLSLIWIMPRAMLLQTPRQLQIEVAARTAELAEVNAQLRAEIAARVAAEEQLRVADRRKDEFLATLAHELRNPLAPIRNALKLLDSTGVEESKRQWGAKVISRQVHRMALLLDDLLDVSRITRSRLELKMEPVDLGSLIASAVETASPVMEERKHTFQVTLPPESITVEVDPLRVSQAVANLLTNAAKYTNPGGHISLVVSTDAQGLAITVKDTGIGFEPSAAGEMFEMFAQVSKAQPTSDKGLGIGLALVRAFIALHGGTVEARSGGADQGSEFRIRIPGSIVIGKRARVALNPSDTPVSNGARCKVLVVDDNRDSADALAMVLEADGYQVLVGYSGQEALDIARESQPDAFILDIGMPDMTGFEVARRIRQEPWGRDVLLVAMTGWGQAKDKERAKAAGFDRHFTKPLDPGELQGLLAQFAEQRGRGAGL
jgi:signal transduction histidine kinase/ActR/RegA family two-component response regulator